MRLRRVRAFFGGGLVALALVVSVVRLVEHRRPAGRPTPQATKHHSEASSALPLTERQVADRTLTTTPRGQGEGHERGFTEQQLETMLAWQEARGGSEVMLAEYREYSDAALQELADGNDDIYALQELALRAATDDRSHSHDLLGTAATLGSTEALRLDGLLTETDLEGLLRGATTAEAVRRRYGIPADVSSRGLEEILRSMTLTSYLTLALRGDPLTGEAMVAAFEQRFSRKISGPERQSLMLIAQDSFEALSQARQQLGLPPFENRYPAPFALAMER